MEVRELWHISESESVLRKCNLESSSTDLIIQSEYSLISSGTERIVAKGMVPESTMKQMKVPYMKGEFPFPVSYGYSLVGKIVKGPENLKDRFIHLMHPHHDFALVRKKDIWLIPDSVPRKRAIFASNLETVVNAIWDSKPQLGDNILIAGFGTVGALLALTLSQYPGIELKIKEINPERRKFALACELKLFDDNEKPETEFDISYHCTGGESGLQFCIDHTIAEGKIIDLSWYGNNSVNINLGENFHTGRKKIISSQVSSIPNNKKSTWNFVNRKELIFRLLQNNIYDRLPCLEIPFEDSPQFFNNLRSEFINEPGLLIRY